MEVCLFFFAGTKRMSRYDIVLYGASGFTGAYVFKLLVEEQKQQNVSFAIAGRNEVRLKKLLENTSQELGKLFYKNFPFFNEISIIPRFLQNISIKENNGLLIF